MDVDANFAVRNGTTDKFTVASSTGNVQTDGNLQVDGNTDLGSDANDTLTISAKVDSDIVPSGTTRDIGTSADDWRDGYFSGTVTANAFTGALTGNVTANSGTSTFNNVTVNGTLSAGNLTGNADTATDLAINATQQLVIQTGNNATSTLSNGTSNYILTSGGGSNAPTWEQNFAGTASQADNVNIDEFSTDANFQVVFSPNQSAGYERLGIDSGNNKFVYNPSSNTLDVDNITTDNIQATVFGTSSQNAYGARTVSTGNPTGGSNGDIWYKI